MISSRPFLLGSLLALGPVACGDASSPPTNPAAGGVVGVTGGGGGVVGPTGGTTGGGVAPVTGGSGGGVAATGGTSGTGGTMPTAGGGMAGATGGGGIAAGTGGTPSGGAGTPAGGMGGTPPAGGMGGVTATGGTGGGTPTACTIAATSEVSSKIGTVGIVTFTADLAGMDGAHIDFGPDASYGMTAPVDLAEPSYRTLLLGMKPMREYHYRVVVSAGTMECTSQDYTLMTGTLSNNLPNIDVQTMNAAALSGDFIITGQYQGSGGQGSPAYIIDKDGDFVWAFILNSDITGVRMSYDGKYMWINSANVPSGQANVHRVSMDGMSDDNLSQEFQGLNHQLTVLPDETVAFYAYSSGNCDDIKERAPDGSVKTIINLGTAHGASGACHANTIQYSAMDDSLIVSDLDHDNYTKVKRDGTVVWVLGGSTSDFTGEGASWSRQHGLHILGLDRLLIFNNGGMGGGGGSLAIEIQLDLTGMTATRAWSYAAMPSIANQVMGDVQRLPNGNTIVAYSTQGVLLEVDAAKNVLREITWPIGGAFGYIEARPTLYGPPPK